MCYNTFGGISTAAVRLWADVYTPESTVPLPIPLLPFPLFHWGTTPVFLGAPLDLTSFTPIAPLLNVPVVTEILILLATLAATTPELAPGSGDVLVSDARAHLPFSLTRTTNPLNHAEALWDSRLQAQVVAILLRLRSAPVSEIPNGQVTVPDVRELGATAAANQIRSAGLVPVFRGPRGSDAWVYGQEPLGESLVGRGSSVTLQMRTGPIP